MAIKIVSTGHDRYVLTEVPINRSVVEKLQTYREEDWPHVVLLALMTGMALVGRQGAGRSSEIREPGRNVVPPQDMRRYLEEGFHQLLSGWEERIVRDFEALLSDLGERR
ncbi:MAG: hypothetical protein OWR62_02875 [Sulfobacillus thermotolerans]|uniref:Uncharacterized protein n=1 Tax=Sulfobacillus thermotolerans TaxID=338644 RepID=A0ABM6RNC5_9FIRM|nr:hypothetical protein BXT84_01735 [Sulfobacillus thermotolerans]MCY0907314.1 hypothetical protein [Sulfobacillus thermotolerans]